MPHVEINYSNFNWNAMLKQSPRNLTVRNFLKVNLLIIYSNRSFYTKLRLFQIWCFSIVFSVKLYNFTKFVTSPGVIRFTSKEIK